MMATFRIMYVTEKPIYDIKYRMIDAPPLPMPGDVVAINQSMYRVLGRTWEIKQQNIDVAINVTQL